MNYKVHYTYINSLGQTIQAGVYDEKELDLAEARNKTILTLVDIDSQVKVQTVIDDLPVKNFDPQISNDFGAVKELRLEQKQEAVEKKGLKINSASEKDIAALKYISNKTAQEVIKLREISPFKSYIELDERVPLKFNRKWQDLGYIEFDYAREINEDSVISYE